MFGPLHIDLLDRQPPARAAFAVLTDFELCLWISDYRLAVDRGQERCGRFLSEREMDTFKHELWLMELERDRRNGEHDHVQR